MKLTQFTHLLVLGLVLTLSASACRKRPDYVTKIPPGQTGNPTDLGPGKEIEPKDRSGGTPQTNPDVRKDWPRDREMFKSDTVHFDFDSSVVKSAEKSKVSAVADYLKAHGDDAVEIEGHCDERGTEEYNRALGDRRALALREELISLGIDGSKIDTLTFGKDKPVSPGHDESAWRLNRRGEFILEVHPK